MQSTSYDIIKINAAEKANKYQASKWKSKTDGRRGPDGK
jgi:hypothetical protein